MLSNYFVPAASTMKVMNLTEPIDQKLKGIVISEPDKSDILVSSVSNTSESRAKINSITKVKNNSSQSIWKQNAWSKAKPSYKAKRQNRRRPIKTNLKGPIRVWVPKS